MAIFSNEYVLGGALIALLIGGGIVWKKSRSLFGGPKKDS